MRFLKTPAIAVALSMGFGAAAAAEEICVADGGRTKAIFVDGMTEDKLTLTTYGQGTGSTEIKYAYPQMDPEKSRKLRKTGATTAN